ncbi:MAG: ADP-ribosylglycohydrolase family protein [Butyrivibrio sp.]|nr:ADP-ribosylglycohydrolase family protein [Butyrivibrio sp.]
MAIQGTILGDIAGSFLEENRRYIVKKMGELDWKRYPFFEDNCQFTDDTVTTLSVKEAVLTGRPFKDVMIEIGRHYPYCGWGHNFYKWLFPDERDTDPHAPYHSFGNGSAMRVSFIGEYFDDKDDVIKKAAESAIISHDHPEGIKGAVTTAVCVWMAKHGKDKDEIYDYMLTQYPENEYSFSGMPMDKLKTEYKRDISCQTSVPVALRCFLESDDYHSFLVNVVSLDCDTDTLAAIGGGIAEEYYGKTLDNADEIIKKFLTDELWEIYRK